MPNFYFTYGDSPQFPYKNGWTKIIADTMHDATVAFRKAHPDVHEDILNCAFFYNETEFIATGMDKNGNGHTFCHEVLDANLILNENNTYIQTNYAHKTVDIILPKIGLVNLPLYDANKITDAASKIYHHIDIMDHIENAVEAKIYNEYFLHDTQLIHSLTDKYHELRLKNDGGDTDSMLNFRECIDTAFEEYQTEILKYTLFIGQEIGIEDEDGNIAVSKITDIGTNDGKVTVVLDDNTILDIDEMDTHMVDGNPDLKVALYS